MLSVKRIAFLNSVVLVFAIHAQAKSPSATLDRGCDVFLEIPDDAKSFADKKLTNLQDRLKGDTDMETEVQQGIYSKVRGKTRFSKATAKFSQSGNFYWLKHESKEVFVSNGKKFFFYSPETNTVAQYNQDGSQAQEYQSIVQSALSLDKLFSRYTLEKAEQVDGAVFLKLRPKIVSNLKELRLKIETKTPAIKGICLAYQDSGDTGLRPVYYEFVKITRKKIDTKEFEFSPPKGARVETYD